MATPPVTIGASQFTATIGSAPGQYTQSQIDAVIAALQSAAALAPALFAPAGTVQLIPTPAPNGDIFAAAGVRNSSTGEWTSLRIYTDPAALANIGTSNGLSFVNALGNRVSHSLERILLHEMRHLLDMDDSDISELDYDKVLVGESLTSPVDSVGIIVQCENSIYTGDANRLMDYVNGSGGVSFESAAGVRADVIQFRSLSNYTNNTVVDLVLHDNLISAGTGTDDPRGIDTRPYGSSEATYFGGAAIAAGIIDPATGQFKSRVVGLRHWRGGRLDHRP